MSEICILHVQYSSCIFTAHPMKLSYYPKNKTQIMSYIYKLHVNIYRHLITSIPFNLPYWLGARITYSSVTFLNIKNPRSRNAIKLPMHHLIACHLITLVFKTLRLNSAKRSKRVILLKVLDQFINNTPSRLVNGKGKRNKKKAATLTRAHSRDREPAPRNPARVDN